LNKDQMLALAVTEAFKVGFYWTVSAFFLSIKILRTLKTLSLSLFSYVRLTSQMGAN
jgi:hypothetical protein